jgi:hypothetical protein
MTPRALLTTIGATAIAFAVAIGVAAGNSTGVNASSSSLIAFAAPAAHDRVADHDWSEGEPPSDQRLAVWNDPCVIAL